MVTIQQAVESLPDNNNGFAGSKIAVNGAATKRHLATRCLFKYTFIQSFSNCIFTLDIYKIWSYNVIRKIL